MQIPEPTTVVLSVIAGSLFGFLSVPHCLGMCGPLHLAMCLSGPKKSFRTLTMFNIGRILGYTFIGSLLGLLGEQATRSSAPKQSVQASTQSVPLSCCEQATTSNQKLPLVTVNRGIRRILMYIFPAVVLLAVGIGGLRKSSVTRGKAGLSGLMGHFFKRFRTSGPLACGGVASLLPCGMLYVAFAMAAGTLSGLLGGVFLLFYCVTISVFMQLSIMVSTAFGRSFGSRIKQAYPWLAFAGATVYMAFYVKAGS